MMIIKCLSFISHFVYKCIKYSNLYFIFLLLFSLFLFNRTKKKEIEFFQKRGERQYEMYTGGRERERERVLSEQGRAQWVTNLIPSSNQSMCMCAGMTDVKETRWPECSCRLIIMDLLDKIKRHQWTSVHNHPTLYVSTIDQRHKVICLVINSRKLAILLFLNWIYLFQTDVKLK